MKRLVNLFCTMVALFCCAFSVFSADQFYVFWKDGSVESFPIEKVDSVAYKSPVIDSIKGLNDLAAYVTTLTHDITDIKADMYGGEINTEYEFNSGYYINSDGTVKTIASGYAITDYIDITNATSIKVCTQLGTLSPAGLAFYSNRSEISFISVLKVGSVYSNNTEYELDLNKDVPTDAKFIRCTGKTNENCKSPYVKVVTNTGGVVPKINKLEKEISNIESKINEKDASSSRSQINISTTDSEIEILDKLMAARKKQNCDVVWEFGEYNFSDVVYDSLKNIGEFKSVGAYELPLGGNCHYYFNGSTIKTTLNKYSGYCNMFGTVRKNCGNYYLYDGTFISNGCCYCVHDEGQNSEGSYIHEYHNMTMIQKSKDENGISKCIGGGTVEHGIVLMDMCVFTNENDFCDDDCSWHGSTKSENERTFKVLAKNNFFSKRLSLQTLGTNQKGECIYCGNSSGKELNIGKWEVKSYCNEIRK